MLKKFTGTVIIILIFYLHGCTEYKSYNISEPALNYLNEVLDILESNSIKRKTINWSEFRQDILERAENISSIDSTYPVIRYAIKKLGDNHSRFVEDYSDVLSKSTTEFPYARLLENNVVYIHIPGFHGYPLVARNYAARLYDYIDAYSYKKPSGWIIDLRENFGGNMWPMLAGLEPLLGEDNLGYFIDADDTYTEWFCKNGSSYYNNKIACSINGKPSNIFLHDTKVAVLLDSLTGSSGEAVAISFKGRKNTKFFGKPSRGKSTGNQSFILSNDAMLVLTTSIFADRNKNKYGGKILPDVTIENPQIINKKENDIVILSASKWIKDN